MDESWMCQGNVNPDKPMNANRGFVRAVTVLTGQIIQTSCVQLDKYKQAKTKLCSGLDHLICLILKFCPTSELAAATHEDAESMVQDKCKLMPSF